MTIRPIIQTDLRMVGPAVPRRPGRAAASEGKTGSDAGIKGILQLERVGSHTGAAGAASLPVAGAASLPYLPMARPADSFQVFSRAMNGNTRH